MGLALKPASLRRVRRREGRYLLRSNLAHEEPATLWQYYIQLTEGEQAFKELKRDLAIRPIYHHRASWPPHPPKLPENPSCSAD